MTVTALGDSVPSGYGCDCAGYVQTFADLLAARTSRAVAVRNDAAAGATSEDVVAAVLDSAAVDLAASDVVLVQVGANDVDLDLLDAPSCQRAAVQDCWGADLERLSANLDQVTQMAMASPRHPLVLLIGYWNVSVDGAVAAARGPGFTAASARLTEAVDAVISGVARRHAALYVDTRGVFDGPDGTRDPTDDLQDDGDHPDADGHDLLARAVLDTALGSGALDRPAAPGTRGGPS
ncbi:SGNH/GDSL hydrolase family protein [Phycicoccus sp. MAQZ13P-2]|uniref:SGNH/GDSL hydrolase family protein n=1 Tax=Phycicoccus mangrovi TaxID=2840470 RepID=UPI001C0048BA|nr:SGNH/GDSL hydrolase family protein [Phycicoccus mangrovi]MBT9276357.1 SGNH/GDSL hydrolase family protein [Phycicoccus mangrovi]